MKKRFVIKVFEKGRDVPFVRRVDHLGDAEEKARLVSKYNFVRQVTLTDEDGEIATRTFVRGLER